jgi:hypothetical protein
MLFSEVYSAYFNAVAAIVTEALAGEITLKNIGGIIKEKAFSESMLTIPSALTSGEWAIMDENLRTPIKHKPQMPLTVLQKRWLKALTLDPRVALFDVDLTGLEDTEPLYEPSDFVFFDRYADGDPFTDTAYIEHFKSILTALKEKRRAHIEYRNRYGRLIRGIFIAYRLEYSAKDDKFRLETAGGRDAAYINLERIESCEVLETYGENDLIPPKRRENTVTFLLTDERGALDRVMLHFSDCLKETARLDDKNYEVRLRYEAQDEAEIAIRVLSFGPMLKVTAPDRFIAQVKHRLAMQRMSKKQISDF